MKFTTTNCALLGLFCLGLSSLAYAQPKLPPLRLVERLPPQVLAVYPDSILRDPSWIYQAEAKRLPGLSRYSNQLTATLPPTSEDWAEKITHETAQQGQQLLAKHGQTEVASLTTHPGAIKQSVRDSVALRLDRQSLVPDRITRLVKDRDVSELSPDRLTKLTEDPLAAHRRKALSSSDELSTFATSPTEMLRGEVMSDTMVMALRQKIADAPVQDLPAVKQVRERPDFKQLLIKRKTSLLDRSYAEATLGIAPQASELIQFVPAVGTYLTRHLSLGIGLDGLIDGFRDGRAIVGLKTLAKIDILPQRLYLQAENTSYFSELSYLYEEAETQHQNLQVPYVGAGVLLDILENKGLNFSLMHRLGDHPFFEEGNANWVVRLGMSFYRQSNLH